MMRAVFASVRSWWARWRARLAERRDMAFEIAALRQQLDMYQRRDRSRSGTFQNEDRLFWCLLSRIWPRWREALIVVQPETVLRWRRQPWWRQLQARRHRPPGRPRIDVEAQQLIRRTAAENALWGSRRIVGELRALGFDVSNSSVRRYVADVKRPRPAQRWSTFFYNHGPYVRDALREAVDDRTRRLLEALQRLFGSTPARGAGETIDEWTEASDESWLMPPSTCDDDSCLCHQLIARARDGPADRSEAA